MDSGRLFRAVVDGALRRVSGNVGAFRGSTALAAALLAGLAAAEAAGQPTGLFREVAPTAAAIARGLPTDPDSITLRRRLVAVDFGQLTPSADTAAAAQGGRPAAPSGVLTLNLFDDASFTGLVRSVATTFSGGYSLSGPLAGVEMGTMTLVVNGEVVAGSVRTPEATYRIRPAGRGLHAVSEVDPSRLPPPGEPIPGRGWEAAEPPPPGPDGGFPAPVDLVPPLPAAFRATGDAPRADTHGSIATDRAALEALYDATGGADWTDSTSWKTDAPLSEWFGVTTSDDGRVVGLQLDSNGLTGRIPDELAGLHHLRWLWLQRNELSGPIPPRLGELSRLGALVLFRNSLTGPIPDELGSLVNLEYLQVGNNDLTGMIPPELGNLPRLRWLYLWYNSLSGSIPRELGNLVNLERMYLAANELTGPIPPELGNLANLEQLDLGDNWGLSGSLPPDLRQSPLAKLDIFFTRACAPADWQAWLATIEFNGGLCGAADVTVDVAVVYTPAARSASGGAAEIAAEIDLMVAETNQAYAESGVDHRLVLVERSEVSYTETGDSLVDLRRLAEPSDGHLDALHDLRDGVGADLLHLVVGESDFGGRAQIGGPFGLDIYNGGGRIFGHEVGHNLALLHDRYQVHNNPDTADVSTHPAYGYVNQRAFAAGAPESSRWRTIMAYRDQCDDAGLRCPRLLRFSNPRQSHEGDTLGIRYGDGSGVTGPADAAAVLNATGPAVALWRARAAGLNLPPTAVGTLPDRRLSDVGGTLDVDVSQAFADPDGDALTYTVSSSAPRVVTVLAAGARVTLTAVGEGTATIRVTATDPGGLSATQSFTATVNGPSNRPPEPVGTLPPMTIQRDDDAVTVAVSGAFRDPDGDALTYGASSSTPSVASVSVSGSLVTVTPASEGTALVTVTATDTNGSNTTAAQTFTVTVTGSSNRPPVAVGTLTPVTLAIDESAVAVDVSAAFRDPDGDRLTYGAASSAPGVASVSVSGSTVMVTPVSEGTVTVTVTATDAGGSNTTATQSFTVTVTGSSNRPPLAVGTLAPLTIGADDAPVSVEVSGAFRDPEGDVLTYAARSSSPGVATVSVSRSTVTVAPVAPGTATVTVTATDTGGSNTSATQTFPVTVPAPFTDRVLVPGETPLKAVHFTELRARIDAVRSAAGLERFAWTDPVLTPGVTPVRLMHLLELRSALAAAYASSGLSTPTWTDPAPVPGTTPIRAAHLMELRAAVVALE